MTLDDLEFDFNNASFEWDEEKDSLNFTKHGIHFKTALKVFRDKNLLIREDIEHPIETRYDVLGKVGKVLFVVITLLEGDVIHIISARPATKYEKEMYEYGKDEA